MFGVFVAALAIAVEGNAIPSMDYSACADQTKRTLVIRQQMQAGTTPEIAKLDKLQSDQKSFTVKLNRLAERADWSIDHKIEFHDGLLNRPEFLALQEDSGAALAKMIDFALGSGPVKSLALAAIS